MIFQFRPSQFFDPHTPFVRPFVRRIRLHRAFAGASAALPRDNHPKRLMPNVTANHVLQSRCRRRLSSNADVTAIVINYAVHTEDLSTMELISASISSRSS
jgi:hypothetical protein